MATSRHALLAVLAMTEVGGSLLNSSWRATERSVAIQIFIQEGYIANLV
jgi:hypothetical protein